MMSKLASGDLVLRVKPMPLNLDRNGEISAGWLLKQMDVAGAIAATKCAKGKVAVVAISSIHFKQPVSVMDVLLSFYVHIQAIGRTSVTVTVDVLAERTLECPPVVKVTEGTLTYVAIDGVGSKRDLPRENVSGSMGIPTQS